MEHRGLPELTWLRKIIVERALTRGDYVLSGGMRSDHYIDKIQPLLGTDTFCVASRAFLLRSSRTSIRTS